MQTLYAQQSRAKKADNNKWFAGINGGVNMYWGDIKFNPFWPAPKMQELQAGGGLVFGRILSPIFILSSELNFSSLHGIQEVYPDTLSFKTQALSFALKGHFNIIRLFSNKDNRFAFFIEGGTGIIAWRSLLQNIRTNDTLNNLGWSNPDKEVGFFIPAGIKFEYQITPKLSTNFTSNYNLVFSDLLDGKAIGNYDSYSYNSLGINYYFGKQKETPKLLPYSFFEIAYDSIASLPSNKEHQLKKEEEIKEIVNPFSIKLEVPEKAQHTGFDISINIAKFGISASGFFRLLVPSGFIPQTTPNDAVSFTKLGYRYEYDFILPMNQDSTHIPIHIKLSEIEKGTFPILVEGEIIDQRGNVFPIKFATYIEIISEADWYQGLLIKELEKIDTKQALENQSKTIIPENTEQIIQREQAIPKQDESEKVEPQKQSESNPGVYRIQIMASKKPSVDLENFITKHKITDELFVSQADGWYRYNLYSTDNLVEAERLKIKARNENDIPDAFVTYYENGKRILSISSTQVLKGSTTSKEMPTQKSIVEKPGISSQLEGRTNILNNKLLYRIEIAIGYDQPIPLYLLQNKVGKEPINEFKNKQNYYYTVGEFEDLGVARAFLEYVKTQFKLESAKVGQYQNNQRIKVMF